MTNLSVQQSDALPVPTTGGLALPDEGPWAGFDNFDDGSGLFREVFGLSMPRLRSDFGRNGKGWIDDLTEEVYDHLNIVILAYPPSRAYWRLSIDEGGGGAPDCRSINMLRPEDDSQDKQSATCASCAHAKWGEDNEKPACTESVNVVAYDVDGQRFLWLRFAGTNIKPFKNYVSALVSRRTRHYEVTTSITLESAKRDKLEWLVAKFSIGDRLSPDEVRPMRDVARQAMEQWQTVAAEMAANEARIESDDPAAKVAAAFDMGEGEEPF